MKISRLFRSFKNVIKLQLFQRQSLVRKSYGVNLREKGKVRAKTQKDLFGVKLADRENKCVFVVIVCRQAVLDGFDQHFQATVH